MKRSTLLPLALLGLAGCADVPTGAPDATTSSTPISSASVVAGRQEIVVTAGASAPGRAAGVRPVLSSGAPVVIGSGLVGSTTNPLTLTPSSCATTATGTVTVSFRVDGNQIGTATFAVPTKATWNGSAWVYSEPVTKSVAPRAGGDPATVIPVVLTVVNASTNGAGTVVPTVAVQPTDILNSNTTGAKLDGTIAPATVHVAFADCEVTNTPPTLTVPGPVVEEATSSAGAAVVFTVSATDLEDGELAATCDYESGDTFPLGTTTVHCSVTDAGGLTTSDSFTITVEDTTAPTFTSFPSGTLNLIAANIHGASFDVGAQGITAADVGGVSEPVTIACNGFTAGTPVQLAIGSTTTVSCTATDAVGNESAASTFDVFVGLNVGSAEFLSPLRMSAPYSGHKLGSTIPHKFLPPTYADGTPATDLAAGLNLTLLRLDGTADASAIEVNDYAAGSTEWRYDAAAGQYVFNLKTGTKAPWAAGSWQTTVSYMGITLAQTTLELRK